MEARWARRLIGHFYNLRNSSSVDYSEVSIHAKLGKFVTILSRTRVDNHCQIGSYTYVGYNCFVTRAKIGRYVSIGNNVSIGPGEHSLEGVSTNAAFQKDVYSGLTARPCTIGNDVWIGVDAIVRRGVVIGDGAVVGANSLVTKDVPPFAIVAGSPARLIRFRIPQRAQERILQAKWWDLELSDARRLVDALQRELAEDMTAPAKRSKDEATSE